MKKKRVRLIRQLGVTDCGIACLAMLYQYYNYNIDISELKAMVDIGRNGMSLAEMKKITEELNFSFSAYGDYINEENLQSILPAIICSKKNHYVVVSEYNKGKFTILNPSSGKEQILFSDLKKEYLRIVAIVKPTKKSYTLRRKKTNFKINVKKTGFFIAVVLTFITQGIVLIPPLIIRDIVNDIEKNNIFDFQKYILVMFIVAISFFVINFLKKKTILILQNKMYKSTIEQMVDKIFKIDLTYFESHLSGDIQNRFNSVTEVNEFISVAFLNTVIDIITAIFCGVLMFVQSKIIFFVILLIAIIQIISVMICNKKARVRVKDYIADQSILEGKMIETLTNIQQIRCMRIENILCENLKKDYGQLILRIKDRDTIGAFMESIVGFFSILLTLSLYILGGVLVYKENINLGTLVSLATLSGYFVSPFQSLSLLVPQLNILNETIIRIKELVDYKNNLQTGEKRTEEFENLSLEDVSFAYFGNSKNDVSNISMEIKKGEKIAIIGTSGSGKTTVTKLLLNVFSKYQGLIKLNGINIKDIRKEDVDKIFSIVTQVPLAINGTIKENVDITNSISEGKIYELLKIVQMYEDVEQFPLKINTYVGENGQNISGGQKQRLAIARALATTPKVLILDEATSNLDPITEKEIFTSLKELNITLIVITHRLNAIKDADKIYLLRNGKIVEEGNHEELMNKNGYYTNMIKDFS